MRARFLIFACCFLLGSCAGLSRERQQPRESDQEASEAGQLPVGRIAKVERIDSVQDRELSMKGVAALRGREKAVLAVGEMLRNVDWSYKYLVVMKGGDERVVESQFLYQEGECLAFRSGLQPQSVSAVRALPGACE